MKKAGKMRWIYDLKNVTPLFLSKLKGKKRMGFYHYSLSGDYFGEKIKWGLGNTVFFLKIIYTLKLENEFKNEIKEAVEYVKSFQKKNGYFFDPLVNFILLPKRAAKAAASFSIDSLFAKDVKRAETRQAISALKLYDIIPNYEFKDIPQTEKEVENYLLSLDWMLPWSAGSHFSHLLFFLYYSNLPNRSKLIDFAINLINEMQNKIDGFWYKGNPGAEQKINGAMKIISGLKAAQRLSFSYFDKMINVILSAENDNGACDNFNIAYVLKYCDKLADGGYRRNEVRDFMLNRLQIYKQYYHPEIGGFSLFKNKASRYYYGALITRGKNEPDMHGTVMFLWGISVISQFFGDEFMPEFREFIT